MIGYIRGTILSRQEDRLLVLANQVGYEVVLPAFVMASLADKRDGDEVGLFIFHQQTERQPKPVLIGFTSEIEKDFFQHFISVEDIGPLKAVKALTLPIGEIARAIESGDVRVLARLKGVGQRTSQKIIATLAGRMGKFALRRDAPAPPPRSTEDLAQQVIAVMVHQLGHRAADARQMIAAALKRNPGIATPEELFEEVYRGEQSGAGPGAGG
jgi:Holliday junction DNA helicase RuvA